MSGTRWVVAVLAMGAGLAGCKATLEATGSAEASGHAAGSPAAGAPAQPAPAGEPAAGEAVAQPTCPTINGNGEHVSLVAGTYSCDLVISGNGNTVSGAGAGTTIVRGQLTVSGNGNSVSGMTIEGGATVSGNENDVSGLEFRGQVAILGTDNVR